MKRLSVAGAFAVLLALGVGPAHSSPTGPDVSNHWTPGNPNAGQQVTFVLSARDSDGAITSMALNFGDGTTDHVPIAHTFTQDLTACVTGGQFATHLSHVYATAGVYQTTLTVTSTGCALSGSMDPQTTTLTIPIYVGRSASSPTDPGPGTNLIGGGQSNGS